MVNRCDSPPVVCGGAAIALYRGSRCLVFVWKFKTIVRQCARSRSVSSCATTLAQLYGESRMESLEIKSADGASSITLVEREPFETSAPIDYFTVQLTDAHLSASARVYANMLCNGLPELFAHIAQHWKDFTGPQAWSSLEGEFTLKVTHDGIGHFVIFAELRSGNYERDWLVKSSVMVETSQLDRIASDVSKFIGCCS